MKKIIFSLFLLLLLVIVTGCSEKTCAQWEIKPAQLEDCSSYETNHKLYCELQNEKKREIRTCVEWE